MKASVGQIKIAAWNVCGLRALLRKGTLSNLFSEEDPDILCLNETMLQEMHVAQVQPQLPPLYSAYFNCSIARKGYSGVAILTKSQPLAITQGMGIAKHDREGRTLIAEYPGFFLVNTYVPNAGAGCSRLDYRTEEWDVDLRKFLGDLQKNKPVVWCGDLNVVHEDIDIYDIRGKETWPCCTPQERTGFSHTLKENRLVDTFRLMNPNVQGWSYFSRRNRNAREKGQGWRIDYILVSQSLQPAVRAAYIRSDIAGSDHHPCFLTLATPF